MDCQINTIACGLDQIAYEIGRPTILEVLSVVLAALAAIGTLWIAYLNLRLLRAQNAFQYETANEQKRMKREVYADLVFNAVLEVLRSRIGGIEPEFEFMTDDFLKANLEAGSESATEVTEFVIAMAWSMPLQGHEFKHQVAASKEIGGVLDKWVQDPGSLDLRRPKQWRSPLDEEYFLEVKA